MDAASVAEKAPPPEPKPERTPIKTRLFRALAVLGLTVVIFPAVFFSLRFLQAPTVWAVPAALFACSIALVILSWLWPGPRTPNANPVLLRYTRRNSAALLVWGACTLGTAYAFTAWRPSGLLAYLIAAAPALPLAGTFVAMGLYLNEETDEFQRRIMVEVLLWAAGGTLGLAQAWGYLELFDLVPHHLGWCAFPLWNFCFVVAMIGVRRRYR